MLNRNHRYCNTRSFFIFICARYIYFVLIPQEDATLGGTIDVQLVDGFSSIKTSADNSTIAYTTLTFTRKLVTGDKYDKDISILEPNDMIYAWGNSDTGGGLVYHGDNHNHIFVDFSKPDGIPDTLFGREESGEMSRELVKSAYYGTLSTFQSQAAGSNSVSGFPYGSVADFADEEPSTGTPLILLSDLERSVVNLSENPKCSLHITTLPATIEEFNHPELFGKQF
jgi:hypothetical protein